MQSVDQPEAGPPSTGTAVWRNANYPAYPAAVALWYQENVTMVGATIRVEFDDAEVRVAVTRLLTASRDMIPLMRDIDDPPRGR